MPSVVFVLYIVSNHHWKSQKTSEKELKTKQKAPVKFIIIIIIITLIIIIVTLYRSVEIIGLQSHISAYLQGLLLQNSWVFIRAKNGVVKIFTQVY